MHCKLTNGNTITFIGTNMVAAVIRLCGCVLVAVAMSLVRVSISSDLQNDPADSSLLDETGPASSSSSSASSLYKEFEAFLVKFHKSSPDRLHDERRFEQFKQSYHYVMRHNSGVDVGGKPKTSASFLLELNEWADLFEEELQQMFPLTADPISIPSSQDDVAAAAADAPQTEEQQQQQQQLFILEGASKGRASLNWAGEDNPLGTSVMSSVENQVSVSVSADSLSASDSVVIPVAAAEWW